MITMPMYGKINMSKDALLRNQRANDLVAGNVAFCTWVHYENTPMQYTAIFSAVKMKILDKKTILFLFLRKT